MRYLFLWLFALTPGVLAAQAREVTDSTQMLGYRFERPTKNGLALAMAGLPTLDGELVSIDLKWGDSVAQITGRVRKEAWASNPEVWGEAEGDQVYFGRLQAYLRGDPRFAILVHPTWCSGCEGMVSVVFLPHGLSGYLVGRPRRREPAP
jgi:hypothetical protein